MVVHTKEVCIELVCDMCGRHAEYPNQILPFSQGGSGFSAGELNYTFNIDDENIENQLDLCYTCAEWLANNIMNKKINRLNNNN